MRGAKSASALGASTCAREEASTRFSMVGRPLPCAPLDSHAVRPAFRIARRRIPVNFIVASTGIALPVHGVYTDDRTPLRPVHAVVPEPAARPFGGAPTQRGRHREIEP